MIPVLFSKSVQRQVPLWIILQRGLKELAIKEFLNFLYIAKGSCGEVRSQLIRANDVGYLTSAEYEDLYSDCRKLSASIMNFIKEIKASDITGAKYKP